METVARLSSTWRNRQLMIAGFLAAFALWFLYDGLIGYPAKHERFLAHQELVETGRVSEWPQLSREKNWPLKPPEHGYGPEKSREQFWMAGIALAGSTVALALLLLSLPRTIRSDGEAAYSDKGKRVPFSAVTSVNKKKWDSKGIAVAHYQANGSARKLVIDDYKYAGAEKILAQIEEHLGPASPAATQPDAPARS